MGLVAGMPRPGGGLSFPCILEGFGVKFSSIQGLLQIQSKRPFTQQKLKTKDPEVNGIRG